MATGKEAATAVSNELSSGAAGNVGKTGVASDLAQAKKANL